jgi:O-methyltransferase
MKNKNCVYYCIYGEDKEYLKLLTFSVKVLNNFFNKEDIFVFTEYDIEEIKKYANVLKVNFPTGYATPMAYRLLLGKRLIEEFNYQNIIHLDADTLVIDNIDQVFNIIEDNKISFATENPNLNTDKITGPCWSGPLLTPEERSIYKDLPSICCGVFGFNKTVLEQLEKIYNNVVEKENNGFKGVCKDQHAFTEFVLKNNLYNYKLQDYVNHSPISSLHKNLYDNLCRQKIYHFAGGVTSRKKYTTMENFFTLTKNMKLENFINTVRPYTMTSEERIRCLYHSLEYIKEKNIIGDYVECGVWKGGNIIGIIKYLESSSNFNSNVYLYDTFTGMTDPESNDRDLNDISAKDIVNQPHIKCYSSLDEVKKNISNNTTYPQDKIKYIVGDVSETLLNENNLPQKISLLRLDTDWYKSTKVELNVLWDRLSEGGVLIIDDYGHWNGCKEAVDEFFKDKKYVFEKIDYTGIRIFK